MGGENWSYSWDTRNVANGDHRLAVWAGDGILQSPEASVNVTVGNPKPSGPRDNNPLSGTAMLALVAAIVLVAAVALAVILMKRRKGPEVMEVAAVEEVVDEKIRPGREEGSGG